MPSGSPGLNGAATRWFSQPYMPSVKCPARGLSAVGIVRRPMSPPVVGASATPAPTPAWAKAMAPDRPRSSPRSTVRLDIELSPFEPGEYLPNRISQKPENAKHLLSGQGRTVHMGRSPAGADSVDLGRLEAAAGRAGEAIGSGPWTGR